MATVSVNPPRTPVTKGSGGLAAATLPNVCKMPGPPAPFVPTPLPNIGKSGDSPKGYSKKVKVEGQPVAIKGASFESMGDIASKGTGGGIVSSNTHGPTKFIGPGSFDVKIEGKNVQYLGDPMLNNCGPSGSPANSATLGGIKQDESSAAPARHPNQTCSDGELDKLQAQKDEICGKIPGGSLSPSKVSPKKLAKVPCSAIKQRIAAQKACIEIRNEIQNKCFGGQPDPVHKQAISEMESGLRHSETLASTNCAPGHPMSGV